MNPSKKKSLLLGVCVALLFLNGIVLAQNKAKRTNINRAYLEYLPPNYYSSTEKIPAIIFLHGHGERQSNITDTVAVRAIENANYLSPAKAVKNGHNMCFTVNGKTECFAVFSPIQGTNRNGWLWGTTFNDVKPFVDYILANYTNVDPDRIYLTGFSMGAEGTWQMGYHASNTPPYFAALGVVSGTGDQNQTCKIAQDGVAVWAFHGTNDHFTVSNGHKPILGMGCVANPDTTFTVYSGAQHGDIPNRAYRTDHSLHNPNLYEWFLTKELNASPVLPPDAPSALSTVATSASQINLTWTDNATNETGFQIERSLTSQNGFSLLATTATGITSYASTALSSNTTYYYRVRAVNAGGSSAYTSESSATTLSPPPTGNGNVTWTNLVGVSVDGAGTLTKTAAYSSAAGAASVEVLPAGVNGWVETEMNQVGKTRTLGLSDADVDATGSTIDYSISFSYNGNNVFVYENGINRGYSHNYALGDVYRIERTGSTILYKRNGNTFYTSSVASSTSLLVDVSLLHTGAILYNTTISFASLPAPSSLTATASGSSQIDLTWSDNSGSETGFEIERSLTAQNGYALVTTTAADATSFSDTGLNSSTTYYYRVRAISGSGNSLYSNETSATTLAPPPGGNGTPVTWTNIVGASDLNGTLTKTAAYGSPAGASSVDVLPAGIDGWVETEMNQTGKTRAVGLSDVDVDATGATIDYSISFSYNNNNVFVYENGVSRGYAHNYVVGDTYRIERMGTTILYKRNGVTFYTSTIASTTSLVADVNMLHTGAVIFNTRISFGTSGARLVIEEDVRSSQEKTGAFADVYPNPVGSFLLLKLNTANEPVKIRIADTTGRIEWEGTGNDSVVNIDLNSMHIGKGIKIVTIQKQDGQQIVKRILKTE